MSDESGNYSRDFIKESVGNNDRCSLRKCVSPDLVKPKVIIGFPLADALMITAPLFTLNFNVVGGIIQVQVRPESPHPLPNSRVLG